MKRHAVLVTGATGFIGSHVVEALKGDPSADLSVLVRSPEDADRFRAMGVAAHVGDITRPHTLPDAFKGREAVIHCAALMAGFDREPKKRFDEVNVRGTANVLRACDPAVLRQFIHISSVGVYGRTGPHPAAEERKPSDVLSKYEWSKREAEVQVTALAAALKLPYTIIRPSQMYGPGMRYGWPEVVRSIKDSRMRLVGRASGKMHLLYIADLVAAIRLVLLNERCIGQVYNVAGPEVLTVKEVFTMISEEACAKAPARVPYLPVYIASLLVDTLPGGLKKGALGLVTSHRVRFFVEDRVYDCSKIARDVGFAPAVRAREGIREMVRWCLSGEGGQTCM